MVTAWKHAEQPETRQSMQYRRAPWMTGACKDMPHRQNEPRVAHIQTEQVWSARRAIVSRQPTRLSEALAFLFRDSQITDERFLVYMNDLLSSGNIPGLFPVEDMDDIINAVRPLVKRAGLPDTRDNCWDMFINAVRDNLHVILCFSPIGDPIKIRTRRCVSPSRSLDL